MVKMWRSSLLLALTFLQSASGLINHEVTQLQQTGKKDGNNVSFSFQESPSSKFGYSLSSTKYKISVITVNRKRATDINDFFLSTGIQTRNSKKDLGHGVTGEFVSDVRQNSLDFDDLKRTGVTDKNYKLTLDKNSLVQEVAITKAHHAAIKQFLRSDSDYALVFESDAEMDKDTYKTNPMSLIESMIEKAPKGWHEINLGRCASECFRQTVVAKMDEKTNLVKAQNQFCSTAYLLSKDGAQKLDNEFSADIKFNNFMMKGRLYDVKRYMQYSVTPRLFQSKQKLSVCNHKQCQNVGECGFTDMAARSTCKFMPPCEQTGNCYSLDVADEQSFNYSFRGYPSHKVAKLDKLRDSLKKKHLRIRSLYQFVSGCGFFTFPLFVINQLEFAVRHGLIGHKAPIVYMPENHHYSDCHSDSDKQTPEFWHKWFKPLKHGQMQFSDVQEIDESNVWEFSQDSIMTAYYDRNSVHAYPYPGDDEWECGDKWIQYQRDEANFIMDNFIHVTDNMRTKAVKLFNNKFEGSGPVLGLHMRGTDKVVHEKVDPKLYVKHTNAFVKKNKNAKVFLATDDKSYVSMMRSNFSNTIEYQNAERENKNVLYNDQYPKDLKSEQVLLDSLTLAQTDSMVKCWSGVSEFAVYFRDSEFSEKPTFSSVIDLESATQKRKRIVGDFVTGPSKPQETCKNDPLPDWGKSKEGETYCCPHMNADFAKEKEAAQLKIGKPKTGKGCFVILAQNKRHETYGRTGLDILNNTLRLLYKNYNNREKDDILVLHEGDFDEETQKKVIAGRPEIQFFHLKGENWAQHPKTGIGRVHHDWAGVEGMGYRKMMRWYAIRVWPALKAKGYKWVCRFDDDSYLLSPIPYNLFGFMEHYGYDYGYRNIARETGLIWDDADGYPRLLRNYSSAYMGGKTGWMLDACNKKDSVDDLNRENCGDFWGFYNNFFVGHIDRFLEPDIQHFLNTIDDTGVIFTKRWNDLLLQSATTQLFVEKKKTFHFTGFTYAHNSGFHDMLHYGIVQIGLHEQKPYKSYISYMEEELKWNMAMHSKYLINVNGLLTLATPNPATCCSNAAPDGWPNGPEVLTPTQMLC